MMIGRLLPALLLAFGLGVAAQAETAGMTPDPAALRAEMARIHAGKVDDKAMLRIDADIAALHSGMGVTLPGAGAGHAAETAKPAATAAPVAEKAPATWKWLDGMAASQERAGQTESKAAAVTQVAAAEPVAAPPAPASIPPATDRTFVGQETCTACHQQESMNWAHTVHAKVFNLNPQNDRQAQNCEACHGPGSAHVEDPSDLSKIIAFSKKSKTPLPEQNGQCLTCHEGGQRIFWHQSIHDSNQVGCSDCHNPMTNFGSRGLTAKESINETCLQCHKAQHAEFSRRSHMPLLEGKLSCTDCHNPHGSNTAPLLKADSVNEVCYTCHAEKRGPFLFEHAPVRESCLNCHSPHGSNFEALLTAPRPVLCQQCHSQSSHPGALLTAGNMAGGAMPDPRLLATSCSTCHTNVHGSNSPSGSRFER